MSLGKQNLEGMGGGFEGCSDGIGINRKGGVEGKE